MKFSKRHNLRLDDAAKRERLRDVVGAMAVMVIFVACLCLFLEEVGKEQMRREQSIVEVTK